MDKPDDYGTVRAPPSVVDVLLAELELSELPFTEPPASPDDSFTDRMNAT